MMMARVHPDEPQHEQRFHNRRMSDQRLEVLTNSPVAKLVSWLITTIFLPVVAWGLLTLLSEVRQLNDAIAKNNTVVAIYDLRITTLEHIKDKRDQEIKALNEKDTEHDTRLTILEQTLRRGK
jgi:hypothetical protein